MNDGAVDAEDFINVDCYCPCEGQVRKENGLIGLVEELRKEIKEIESNARKSDAIIRDITALNTETRELYAQLFNDEGQPRIDNNLWHHQLTSWLHAVHKFMREDGSSSKEDEEDFRPRTPVTRPERAPF